MLYFKKKVHFCGNKVSHEQDYGNVLVVALTNSDFVRQPAACILY